MTPDNVIAHGPDCTPDDMGPPDTEGISDCYRCGLWETTATETSGITRIRDTAREQYQSDDIEIDLDATVSWAENGAWVAAWVYVSTDYDLDK